MRLSDEILVSEERIAGRVAELAAAITADTPAGAPLSVIALMDGALMFCADLVRRLPMPVRIAPIPLRSVTRGGDPGGVELPADFLVENAEVLVVEDILDTARTLDGLAARLRSLRPARLRSAVLLDKPARRVVEFTPDYVGFTVADRWVVGYGLDFEGLYRNLPYLTWVE